MTDVHAAVLFLGIGAWLGFVLGYFAKGSLNWRILQREYTRGKADGVVEMLCYQEPTTPHLRRVK